MSLIKEIVEITKEGVLKGNKISAIKRALRTELKLNSKFLNEVGAMHQINDTRRKEIIDMLEITELADALKYELPYKLICNKKVNKKLVDEFSIKRIFNFDFEMLVESLYIKIKYLKKDKNNKNIHLNLRLMNIYKYNAILLKLISE